MGNFNKIHDLALKADYEKALQTRSDYNFEYDVGFILIDFHYPVSILKGY